MVVSADQGDLSDSTPRSSHRWRRARRHPRSRWRAAGLKMAHIIHRKVVPVNLTEVPLW